ncbi:MAG TPA: FGGY-family carbohydrate kinase [Terriglobia bacterium]|nr:FGGY-family carbohydrate kinase [Terriglobia bacterium]
MSPKVIAPPPADALERLKELTAELAGEPAAAPEAQPLGRHSADQRALVAVDLGAESCRVSLLRWFDGTPRIELVHRFPNGPMELSSGLRWDLAGIWQGVEEGLRRCADIVQTGTGKRSSAGIASIAVDGWAVDYVRLGAGGQPLGDPYCYRDPRTIAAENEVLARTSAERLYAVTGIQQLRINTLYQLYADGLAGVPASAPWVNLPEYILHRLGGRRISEYTNATHTQLVDLKKRAWSEEVFEAAGLDLAAAPELVPPGTNLGFLKGPLAALRALRTAQLIAPACHDTASAIAGIPASGSGWAYISSGTWSLVGTLLDEACTSAEARRQNFTNEGGVGGQVCFLKNVNGMWLLQQCLASWQAAGRGWTLPELIALAERLPAPETLLDVDDPDLLLPGNMPARINAQRQRAGLPPCGEAPDAAPAMANLIFHSLAARYAEVLKDVAAITGKQFERLYIAGGGSRNAFLNELSAERTGLEVRCAAVESSTLGNFAIQLASLQGAYDRELGVQAAAVAHWAAVLTEASGG